MKKRLSFKKILLTILIVLLLIPSSLFSYLLLRHYVFYPRTVEDIISKYENMDKEEASDRGFSMRERPNGEISIIYNGGGFKRVYKNSHIIRIVKNRVTIVPDETVGVDFVNEMAKKYKAEIVKYQSAGNIFTIEFKREHSLKKLEEKVEEIKKLPHVEDAYEACDIKPSTN